MIEPGDGALMNEGGPPVETPIVCQQLSLITQDFCRGFPQAFKHCKKVSKTISYTGK